MTNIISFQDYKQSIRPKKRMIDADVLLETIADYLNNTEVQDSDKKILIGLHLFIDMYADLNK